MHAPVPLVRGNNNNVLRPNAATRINLSYTGVHNTPSGTQALPREWLNTPETPYTWPDSTENYLNSVNLQGRSLLGTSWLISGNLYWRHLRSRTIDSNVNDDFDPSASISIDNAPGENERSEIHTNGYGGALELTSLASVFEHDNQLSVRLTTDSADTDFSQHNQPAQFVDTRDDEGFALFQQETRLDAENHYYGIYWTDTFTIVPRLDLTLSGRYNIARVKLKDRLGTALSGDHHFARFNPAVGLTFRPLPTLTTYVRYAEGTRMPTPVEPTCASPKAPCKLPNEFLAFSDQYARGDENNRDHNGTVPGYAVVNLDAHYQPSAHWGVFVKVDNLFDRDYQTLGVLGENAFTGPGRTFDAANTTPAQFRSPGAPRGVWVGLRARY